MLQNIRQGKRQPAKTLGAIMGPLGQMLDEGEG